MKKHTLLLLLLISLFNFSFQKSTEKTFALVIHGGAGTILKQNMSPEKEKAYMDALDFALQTGYKILSDGGSSIDAVEATIKTMEDSPLFNAGKGAVFNAEGKNELDASIMEGKTLMAGSVASLTTVKNPISAAKTVMIKSPHVMMIGKGAEEFAKKNNLEIVDPSYFYTEDRYQQWKKAKAKADSTSTGMLYNKYPDYKYGTVGAVALDKDGNIAAGTSTGGMTMKKYGRVGDSPIIGAGTYANNNTCGVSCTGWGEYFIRSVVAYDISALMEYKNYTVSKATEEVILKKVPKLGGNGGAIAMDNKGNISMTFNTEGMYRGYIKSTGEKKVMIYK
jgi:L-asparaginase / beta-aspartyl-peptidase